MKLDKFINRPVLSTVISILIVILGVLGLTSLPVTEYPDIAPPTIEVSTTYSGADAQTVLNSVIAPLEESINGVENMTYMTSTASNNGSAKITVYFKQGSDPDMAAVNVQNRVSSATNLLPSEVVKVGVTTAKRQNSMLVIFSIHGTDNRYDEAFLQNYANINILPQIKRIPGVGSAEAFGAQTYSMRIWLKPDVMKLYHLIPNDVTAALAEQNIEAAPGQFGESGDQSFQYVMRYKGRLQKVSEFENIIIKATPDGQILKLKDVARVELGGLSYAVKTTMNGTPGVVCAIYQTAGSNATAIIKEVQKTLEEAQKSFPPGVTYSEMLNSNDFLFASIHEVIKTLIEAFILVFIVVYIFLQDFRSTLVPAIAVPVSLIGTFFFLYIFGFSINLLTLFALVLAIAIVVDDAIVVVEAVHAKLDQGYKSARLASIDAMSEISGAIVSITLVMAAVFVPVTFMGGTSGVFYTQFGITLAVAIIISALNALTLSPALCAILLKPHSDEHNKKLSRIDRFHKAFNAAYDVTLTKYKKGVQFFIHKKWLSIGTFVVASGLLAFLMMKTPTGLVPNEDTGIFFITVSLPPGSSLEKTEATMGEVDKLLVTNPLVQFRGQIMGYSFLAGQGSSYGTFICRLKPWEEREGKGQDVNSIIGLLYAQTSTIKDAQILIFAPPMISGFSATNGFEFSLEDKTGGDVNKFFGITQGFLTKLNQRPEIAAAQTSFDPRFPQYMIDVDVAKCKRAGISPSDVLATLQGYYGGLYASNFNRFGKLYRVMIQADPQYRVNPESLNSIYLRNGAEMAPVSEFITMKKIYGPQNITRFNMFTSMSVNGSAAQGYSSGDAIKAIQEVAAEELPAGYSYEFAGLTRSEQSSSNSTAIVFALCIMFVYFILSAQYESYILPLTVILSLPFGLAGTFIFANVMGIANNIYLQIALIMLIGLLAKNAILITEFALERRQTGMAITWSAILAAAARLRPILMTSLAMIIGLLPLMFASGVGANGNSSLGTGAVGGMLIGMICQIFIVPVFFVIFQSIQEKIKPIHFDGADQKVIKAELEQYTNLHKDKKK
ncbi:efflux RND transporter permease subunit [uncultured Bacteroides sp.]|uniref:efflux RND transporter permease subunit n=1 Tax=uncultured Bacteroides sp. TaxID=162156 RepID=UPI002AABFC88|nr:efflux RND transporter permease subunit [uncultured Bacteroides sp.]